MGKATKNRTGGDERDSYVRRYKSTKHSSNASSSETALAKSNGEPQTSYRSTETESTVKNSAAGKNNHSQKSKLRTPSKVGLGLPINRVNKSSTISIDKEVKKFSQAVKAKSQMSKMKMENESVEIIQKPPNSPINSKEQADQIINEQINELNHSDEQASDTQGDKTINILNVNKAKLESTVNGLNGNKGKSESSSHENGTSKNGRVDQNGDSTKDNIEKEDDFNLQLEADDNLVKLAEDEAEDSSENNKNDTHKSKNPTEEPQESLPTDTESYSVDVVESTTSEMTEASESAEIKTNTEGNTDDVISYNSNIELKNVQIKLNDCLKEKTGDDDTADQSQTEHVRKEVTFGKTLRTLSGRHSIGRMRHITLRERQESPNSSLFVNTSSVSVSDDGSTNNKTPSQRITLSELSNNGETTPADRKRKLSDEHLSAVKKPKSEDVGLLNASFEFLKHPFGLKRPAQNSTPCKSQVEEHNVSTAEEVKPDGTEPVKKWCVIM